jgi:uncharacterized membrane protein
VTEQAHLSRLFRIFDARIRSVIAFGVAILTYFILGAFTSYPTRIIAAWDGFAVTLLVLMWTAISVSTIDQIRHRARTQDVSRFIIFIFTIGAACLSIFAVVALLSAAKQTSYLVLHVILSIVAVISSWSLVHTMFGLRYAHFYYDEGAKPGEALGGLEFPGDDCPDYFDFAYFSFVIGMTCQVSDVQITSKRLRTMALVHGVLSFCFNTVILALTINTVSSLL